MLRKADPSRFPPENGADYPKSRVGQTMQQVAQLHKADIGLEVTFVDTGGWDNHVNEGGAQGQLANLLRDSVSRSRRSRRTWATAWKTSSSSRCRNSAARRTKTAIAAPITATPTACS